MVSRRLTFESLKKFQKDGKNYSGLLGKRIRVQCFPLYSVLMALGNPTIHFFSLDIEGAELMVSDNESNHIHTGIA